jgi:hypothetical protein
MWGKLAACRVALASRQLAPHPEIESMAVVVPTWFKGRQGKAEEAGPRMLKLAAPNLRDWYLGLRHLDDGRWQAFLREKPDAPDAAVVEVDRSPEYEAWEAAFEIYRNQVII